ncbi:uncharacterized protein TNCV_267911 [Trichonephila clavipes]|nr:uncharacterized protein TNCV_267911 [Trichonephila clavipes]
MGFRQHVLAAELDHERTDAVRKRPLSKGAIGNAMLVDNEGFALAITEQAARRSLRFLGLPQLARGFSSGRGTEKSHGIPSSPRAAAVAKFRLLTGHDCLCAHLYRFNLVTSPICVLCDTGQDMTAAHLDECSALNDLNCIVKSDEAHFWLNGYVNKQNCRIWREANPQVYVETPLHPEKLTVWCALWAGGILLQKTMKATTLQSMVIGIEP